VRSCRRHRVYRETGALCPRGHGLPVGWQSSPIGGRVDAGRLQPRQHGGRNRLQLLLQRLAALSGVSDTPVVDGRRLRADGRIRSLEEKREGESLSFPFSFSFSFPLVTRAPAAPAASARPAPPRPAAGSSPPW